MKRTETSPLQVPVECLSQALRDAAAFFRGIPFPVPLPCSCRSSNKAWLPWTTVLRWSCWWYPAQTTFLDSFEMYGCLMLSFSRQMGQLRGNGA